MTSPSDLIRRGDAQAAIRAEMKRTYTAARRQGFKESLEILGKLPARRETPPDVPVVVQSPALVHSHWIVASCWWFCNNCGGRASDSRTTPYCPWCGARMDELLDQDIE